MKNEAAASMDDAKKEPISLKTREKIPVDTTQGTLYVRHLSIGDMSNIAKLFKAEEPDLTAAGRAVLLRLTSLALSGEDKSEIDKTIFDALTEQDLRLLAATIASESHLSPLADGEPLLALGRAVHGEMKRYAEKLSKTLADIKEKWDAQSATFGETTRASLQNTLRGIVDISNRLRESSSIEGLHKKFVDSTSQIEQYLRTNKSISEAVSTSENIRDLVAADGIGSRTVKRNFLPQIQVPDLETLPISRAAKATEETVHQLTEVAGLLGQMGASVGELSTTIVGTAIPEWMKKLDSDRESTQKTLDQARNSLRWTKWAVIVSVLVTMVMTAWQVWLAREYKLDNDHQQNAIESLLRTQLEEAKQFRKQAAEDADKTRALFNALPSFQKEKITSPRPKISPSRSIGK